MIIDNYDDQGMKGYYTAGMHEEGAASSVAKSWIVRGLQISTGLSGESNNHQAALYRRSAFGYSGMTGHGVRPMDEKELRK